MSDPNANQPAQTQEISGGPDEAATPNAQPETVQEDPAPATHGVDPTSGPVEPGPENQ